MDVFRLRETVIHEYANYVRSFVQIREAHLNDFVTRSMKSEASHDSCPADLLH